MQSSNLLRLHMAARLPQAWVLQSVRQSVSLLVLLSAWQWG